MQQTLANFRTMFLFRGIVAILFGILTFVWPGLTLATLVFLFGIFAIITGITAVAASLRNTQEQGWGFLLFEGIVGILAGVVALIWPGVTALVFLYLLAAWSLLTGILALVAPLSFPMSGGRAFWSVISGLLSIVFGVLIVSQPASGLLTVAWLIGVYAVVIGITYVAVYFQSRSLQTSLA